MYLYQEGVISKVVVIKWRKKSWTCYWPSLNQG